MTYGPRIYYSTKATNILSGGENNKHMLLFVVGKGRNDSTIIESIEFNRKLFTINHSYIYIYIDDHLPTIHSLVDY